MREPSSEKTVEVPVIEKSTIEEEKELPMELPEAFRFMTNGKFLPRPSIRRVAFATVALLSVFMVFKHVFLHGFSI